MLTTPLLRTHRMVSIPCLVLGWLLTFDPIVSGQEAESVTWNRFRGPNGSGLDASQPLPADMAPDKARWKLKLPGTGHSSPVIWGDHVFVSSVDEQNQFHLQAIHRDTGGEIWQWTTTVEPHPMHRLNKIASSTPTTDGKRVYVLVPAAESLRLVAIDMQGKLVWERDFGRWVAQHGFGTSAVVLEGKVIFVNSQEAVPRQPEPGTSEIIAVSSETGGDLWRTPIAGDQACYSVPLLGEDAQGEPTLFAATCGEGFMALDLQTGQRRWDMNPFKLRIVGSPILLGTQLICNNGSGGGGNFLVSVDAMMQAMTWSMNNTDQSVMSPH